MTPGASLKSAALAGAWTAFGLVPFEMWMEHHKAATVLENNLLWLVACALFFYIPGYFYVLGSDNQPFSPTWFLESKERQKYSVVAKRVFAWFLSAGVFGIVWSPAMSVVFHKASVP